jgi:hypothetical protein
MNEFWVSSGHLLLDRDGDGRLRLTDDFLRAFLARPELLPPEEACDAERALHAALMQVPTAGVDPSGLADADAAENWGVFLAFRDALVASPTIEVAYLRLALATPVATPKLFLDQLLHVILRNALHGSDDAAMVRAAELFFRPQKVSFHNDTLLLADADTIEVHEHARHSSPLLAFLAPPAVAELAVLSEENAGEYWGRSDAFDMVLNLGGVPDGRAALGRAIRLFVHHMLGLEVEIESLAAMDEPDFSWFVGLDSEATRIGNAMWRGEEVPESGQLLALYRLWPERDAPVLERMRGKPIYLMLAADRDNLVRLKPQNLLSGLPLAEVV